MTQQTLDTPTAQQKKRTEFLDCGPEPLGFYPVVDSVEWLKRLLPLGVTTAQLRIKDLPEPELVSELEAGIQLARQYKCRLFINDYWQYAIKFRAYGVHLGQEDLDNADLAKISAASLRLGLSTHCLEEVKRAQSISPSYVAIGPIFFTTLKSMNFAPQGIEAFKKWRAQLDMPLVAIGGIGLQHADELIAAGADGIAMVSEITKNENPEARAKEWLQKFSGLKLKA